MARSPWTSGRKPRPAGGKPTVAWVAKSSFEAESAGGDEPESVVGVADASVAPIWRRRNEEVHSKDLLAMECSRGNGRPPTGASVSYWGIVMSIGRWWKDASVSAADIVLPSLSLEPNLAVCADRFGEAVAAPVSATPPTSLARDQAPDGEPSITGAHSPSVSGCRPRATTWQEVCRG